MSSFLRGEGGGRGLKFLLPLEGELTEKLRFKDLPEKLVKLFNF